MIRFFNLQCDVGNRVALAHWLSCLSAGLHCSARKTTMCNISYITLNPNKNLKKSALYPGLTTIFTRIFIDIFT